MSISSVGPRYNALTPAQPARRPAGGVTPANAQAYPAYPQQPGYPAYPQYPSYPQPQRGGVGHGLGLIASGLGEVGGAAARGLWSVATFAGTAAIAVVGFAASAVGAILGGAWHVLANVGRALGRGGSAIFDPGYDDYRRQPQQRYPQQPQPYNGNRPYAPQPDYPSYQTQPSQNGGPWAY